MEIVVSVASIKDGSPVPVGEPQTFRKEEVTIGRAARNDLVLPAPNVSSKHATLRLTDSGGGVLLTDLGSSNGTYVEELKIPANVPTPVSHDTRVVMGSFVLKIEVVNGTSRPSASESGTERSSSAGGAGSAAAKGEGSRSAPSAVSPAPPVGPVPRQSGLSKDGRYDQEIRIQRQIHDQLIQRLDLRRKDINALSEAELRSRARTVIEQVLVDLRWELPEGLNRDLLIKHVLDEALGLGPLEELLADESCSEIMVNSYRQIYAERNGRLGLTELRFSSEQSVLAAIERIISPIGRRVDEASPIVDARLKDGSRVNAVIRPLALAGPCITIRKFSKVPLTIDDLVRFGSMSKGMADFLKMAVETRMSVVISGGTGSGKTTLLNVISSFIPDEQRVITVEDAAELRLPQEHVVAFETRPPNLEGKGAITIRDLVRNALRTRPDRIIVGECRGAESLDMLQAMNTGHDGSMTTGHANSPADMMRRLETMVLTAGLDLPVRAIREQIASAVNIVVQQTRFSCGTRKVIAISEILGLDPDEGVLMLQDIFLFRQDGYGEDGRVKGVHQATGYIPKFFRKLQERGLEVDASVFSPN